MFTPANDATGPEHGVFSYEFSWNSGTYLMSVDVLAAATAMQLALEPPVVQGAPTISDAGEDGSWGPGETVEVTVSFDVSMFVDTTDGTPTIGIALGGTEARTARYVRGHNTTDLVFSYTLTDADGSHDSMIRHGGQLGAQRRFDSQRGDGRGGRARPRERGEVGAAGAVAGRLGTQRGRGRDGQRDQHRGEGGGIHH